LGYVGLPLAVEFAKAGFTVTGIDISEEKTSRVNAGDSYVGDIPSATLAPLVESGKLRATTDFSAVLELDTINICVPTPLRKTKDPDMSFIVSSCQEIARHFHAGMLVILESTTYPGTTDELVLPMLTKSGLKWAAISSCAFRRSASTPAIRNTRPPTFPKWWAAARRPAPKWAACSTRRRWRRGAGQFHAGGRDGEAAGKHLPHDQHRAGERNGLMCDRMGINVWEVIDAAATKPFGFMPFYPGPGLGGHCIPIDPFYLSWKTKQAGIEARFIELAGYINGQMPHFVVTRCRTRSTTPASR
jgi:UDP-N-acetyl-D-glucosamine dehydrogenase